MELCFPRSRSLLSTLSGERVPVTSLCEAIDEFSLSLSGWPIVPRGEYGGDWSYRESQMPSVEQLSEEHHTQSTDQSHQAKPIEHFLNDTVKELHQHCFVKTQDSLEDETSNHEEESVKSLVRQVIQLRLPEHLLFYNTIEKATVAILRCFESTAGMFVDAVSKVVWKNGSEALCVYKLLLAAVEIPAVKRAVMKENLLCLLMQQYELMTQILPRSTSSSSYNTHSALSEVQMEIGEMQCFTCPQLSLPHSTSEKSTNLDPSGGGIFSPSVECTWTQGSRSPTSSNHIFHSVGSVGNLSTLSCDLVEASQSNHNQSNLSRANSMPEADENRQDVPKLSFYWLRKHEEKRLSANSGTTRTTMSFPDERSILFGDERELMSLPRGGQQPARLFTLTQENEVHKKFHSNSNIQTSSVDRTLSSWGMKPELISDQGLTHSVAYSIKCTIFEIFCAFSLLNLDKEIYLGLENTQDYRLLFESTKGHCTDCIDILDDKDVQHPTVLAVTELLASPWQVFPGEQPPIRWGPTSRGAQLALAILHEFACRPLNEVEIIDRGVLDVRLFIPQDLMGESYHSLIGGVKGRLTQIAGSSRIMVSSFIEEATCLINLLCDFVASSPSSSQAPLVAYSCSDAFASLESALFFSVKIGNWRLSHFRAFHALLRVYKCILERATDIVLIDFLISTLLERLSWVRVVKDFVKTVMFSQKLEKKCDPEELACLRLGVWSYHTALVKVVARNQREENSQDSVGYLPEDFQDFKPAAYGQDPLDFLSFLFDPESGMASQVLKNKEWATTARSGFQLAGGLHVQVLLFLKALFSVPTNEFIRQHEITTFYLTLHWTSFKGMYAELNTKRDETTATVCRLHLEVLREILKHHTLDIFAVVRKLGVITCLANEIALEASISNQFNNFNPPPSELTMASLESEAQTKSITPVQIKSSDTEVLNSSGQYSFFSSSAAKQESSTAFNSLQDDMMSAVKTGTSIDLNQTSDTLRTEDLQAEFELNKSSRKSSRKKKKSLTRSNSDSIRKVISKTFSFRSSAMKGGNATTEFGEAELHCSFGTSPLFHFDNEPVTYRSIEEPPCGVKSILESYLSSNRLTPSRIPKLRFRRSPRKRSSSSSMFILQGLCSATDEFLCFVEDGGMLSYRSRVKCQSNVDSGCFSIGEAGESSQSLASSVSLKKSFPSFVLQKFSHTKIPRLPTEDSNSSIRQTESKNLSPDENEEAKKINGLQAFSNFFTKKKKTLSSGGIPSFDKEQTLNNPLTDEEQKTKKTASLTGKQKKVSKKAKGFFPKKKTESDSNLSNSITTNSQNGAKTVNKSKSSKKLLKKETANNTEKRPVNRTARPVDGPSKVTIPTNPSRVGLSLNIGSTLSGRDSPLSYRTSVTSDRPRSRLKSLNVPLLNLSGITDTSHETRTATPGQTSINISISSEINFRRQNEKKAVWTKNSSKVDSGGHCTHSINGSTDGNGPPTFGACREEKTQDKEIPSNGEEILEDMQSSLNGGELELSVPNIALERTTRTLSAVESESYTNCFESSTEFECTGNVAEDCKKVELLKQSYYGSPSTTDFSEFFEVESINEEEGLKLKAGTLKLKIKEQRQRPENLTLRSTIPNDQQCSPSHLLESKKPLNKECYSDERDFIKLSIAKSRSSVSETKDSKRRASIMRPTTFSEDVLKVKLSTAGFLESTTQSLGQSISSWNQETTNQLMLSSMNESKPPSELKQVENLNEDNTESYLKGDEEKSQLCFSSTLSSIGSSDFDSVIDTGDDALPVSAETVTIVPKLQFPVRKLGDETEIASVSPLTPNLLPGEKTMEYENKNNLLSSQESAFSAPKVPTLNLNATSASSNVYNLSLEQTTIKTVASKPSLTPADELSTFSWLHVSTKDTISDSEFAKLLNGGTKSNLESTKEDILLSDIVQESGEEISQQHELNEGMSLCPCEKLRRERYVYSDVELRIIFVEVLLEGMLLEYSTRAARDRDRCYADVENITKAVPRTLKHHLNDKISVLLVKSLNDRLLFQSRNLHRLLRLFCHSFFSVDLYKSVDHLGRGAFSHVHRCDLPFTSTPKTCAIKIMDHPIGHNEMSNLMDVYSEIYILEQFRDDPNVCSLYDYGVNRDSVFMVMKDYKCSLLEWRKKFPEQCAGALKLFLRIFQDIVSAVKKLHDNNVVHFDLKCSNVLLEPLPGISEEHFWNPPTEDPPFRVVLADFGEARSYHNNWEAKTVRNRGTEFNKSPEMLLIAKAQRVDDEGYDRRKRIGAGPPSDVWALGCLLFELITGELLQLDAEWSRFFVRVTTNTMNVVDKEKQKMLPTKSRTVIGDLLDYILVRTHLWRPNLRMLSRKLETVMISGRIAPYVGMPRKLNSFSTVPKRIVDRRISGIEWMGNIQLITKRAIAFSREIQVAPVKSLLNPWFLLDNSISVLICVRGHTEMESISTRLKSTASRASLELLEICLEENKGIEKDHVDIIVSKIYLKKACFTCERGYEGKTMELVIGTLQRKENLGDLESILQLWRQFRI
eukprot:g4371.t1